MIIGTNLKKLLNNNNNRLAKEFLKLETSEATFENDVDYVEIAIDNPAKISFVTQDRYNRIIETGPKRQDRIKRGDKIILTEDCFNKESLPWFSRSEVKENNFVVNSTEGTDVFLLFPSWHIRKHQIANYEDLTRTDIPDPDNIWNTELRQKLAYMTSPGKFIKKFNIECEQKEIEEFNRLFRKDDICLRIEGLHFELVSGNQIKWGYLEDNYYNNNGSLGSSCMRYENTQDYIQLYADYPKQIKLLLLLTAENKVRGRAIVWNCFNDSTPIIFMDRIYVDNSNFEEYFISYAERNNWWRKVYQSRSDWTDFYTPEDNYSNIINTGYLNIILENAEGKKFPYTDTFVSGDVLDDSVRLYNNQKGDYDFQDTEGGPFNEDNMVYSEYYDRSIPQDDAVYSNYLEDHLIYDEAVNVIISSRGTTSYMPEDHEDIVEIGGNYYLEEICMWSDYYGEYIHEDIDTIISIQDGKDYVYKDDAVYCKYDNVWYLSVDCVYSEFEDDYILEDDAIEDEIEGWIRKESLESLLEERKEEKLEEVE